MTVQDNQRGKMEENIKECEEGKRAAYLAEMIDQEALREVMHSTGILCRSET